METTVFGSSNFLLLVVVGGYGLWFALAVANNILDFQTNRLLIARMMSMKDIKEDPVLGNNLQWRAIDGLAVPTAVYCLVIVYQLLTVFAFTIAGADLALAVLSGDTIDQAVLSSINVAFMMALCLWFGFLIGGLWFGYWIKMQNVQTAHILLTILTLFCIGLTYQTVV